jgi:IS30 family transposase
VKIRADIAALVREGHTNTSIAHRLGCSRGTVNRVRQALRLPHADTLGRIYAEELPTGRVTEYKPARQPISPHRAEANRAQLLAALAA